MYRALFPSSLLNKYGMEKRIDVSKILYVVIMVLVFTLAVI